MIGCARHAVAHMQRRLGALFGMFHHKDAGSSRCRPDCRSRLRGWVFLFLHRRQPQARPDAFQIGVWVEHARARCAAARRLQRAEFPLLLAVHASDMPVIWREGVGVEPTAAGSAPPATGFEDRGIHRDTCLPTQHYLARAKLPPNRVVSSGGYWQPCCNCCPAAIALPCWFLYNAEDMNAITHRLLAVLLLSSFTLAGCQVYGPISPLLVVEKVLLNGSSSSGTQGALAPTATPTTAAEAAAQPTPAAAPDTEQAAQTGVTPTATLAQTDTVPAEEGVVAAVTTADYSPTMPVALSIPAVDLQAQVTPMGWEPVLDR